MVDLQQHGEIFVHTPIEAAERRTCRHVNRAPDGHAKRI